jgi:hypothetical protein
VRPPWTSAFCHKAAGHALSNSNPPKDIVAMNLARAIALSALAALLSAEAAPLPFTQDLRRIAAWVKAAPSKDPLRVSWQRALREMNCSPSGELARVPERQVLRCTVNAERAAALGSVITAMELRTFAKPPSYSAEGEVWKRSLSFEFQSGKGPTAGSLLSMNFKRMRQMPASPPVPHPHGPAFSDACPIEFQVETNRSTKVLLIGTRQRDGGCTGYADELLVVGSMEAPAR